MWQRVAIGILILIFGLLSILVLASSTPADARSQTAFVIIGIFAYSSVQILVPRLTWISLRKPLYMLTIVLLIVTLAYGKISKGAQRWLPLGPIHVQVSEPAKLTTALLLSALTIRTIRTQRQLIIAALVGAIPFLLIFVQPDLGSALVIGAITTGMVLARLGNARMIVPWVLLAGLLIGVMWHAVLYDYQKQRITSFLGLTVEDRVANYNARQALIAVGSGKLTGRGIGHGVQSQLRFLPEYHTDFFFASYAEELGFLGVLLLVGLFVGLIIALLHDLDRLEPIDRQFRIGIASWIMFQAIVHIYMNIGLSPVTGIPLPFLSSGGSSFVALCAALGIAMSFAKIRHRERPDYLSIG